jgi:hypothetical protein
MPIHPPVTVTFAPSRLLVHSTQSFGNDPVHFLLGVPTGPQALFIFLSPLTTFMEVLWRKDLQNISWGFSGLEADFFNRSRSWLSEIGGNCTLRPQSSFQNRQVIR